MGEDILDRIWLYSKYYGEMIATAIRLNELGESYAALLILFNVMELIFKSLRESDTHNLINDIQWLHENGYLTDEEKSFLNSENGVRNLRNKMTHKDFYEYCIEIDDKAYPFADKETWNVLYEQIAPTLIFIIYNAVSRKM